MNRIFVCGKEERQYSNSSTGWHYVVVSCCIIKHKDTARFEINTAVLMTIEVFFDVKPCCWYTVNDVSEKRTGSRPLTGSITLFRRICNYQSTRRHIS